jgi:nitrate/TMAO reductase-like tetraheme cytochrome c subunit
MVAKRFVTWLPNLWSNPVTLVGSVITTVSACALLLLFGLDVSGLTLNPYTGVLLLVGLPGLFVFGLLLVPFGLFLYRSRAKVPPRPLGEAVGQLFTTREGRRKLYVIVALTVVNLVLLGGASQRLVAWTSDPTFCGTACHGVMEPEWVTYHDSPHARVACVECHVGAGAGPLIRSKMDGLRQVWMTLTDRYERPVAAPVHSMRPSKDTCEQCHWPDRWHGDRPILRAHTYPDEANTERVNVLVLRLGGRHPTKGVHEGIHWHAAGDAEVRYETYDEKRTRIGKVTVLRGGRVVEEFLPPGEPQPVHETRTMDCIDCHNRPTHVFDASPAHALDDAFAAGTLDRGVRWLREVAEPVLAVAGRPRGGVEAAFRRDLEAAYHAKHPDAVPDPAALDRAAAGLAKIWSRNVFPSRGVTWGTYPSHRGHQTDSPALHGCFRCHDDKHKTAAGKALSGECEVCHETVAQDEKRDELEESVRSLIGNASGR